MNAHFGCATKFNLDALKKNPVTTQKKVDTVIVTKKGSFKGSFFNSIKNTVGLSFIFERIIPSSWKKLFGFRRASVINFLTTATVMINLGPMGYFGFYYYPLIFKKLSFFGFYTDRPHAVEQPPVNQTSIKKPIEPIVVVPCNPEPGKIVPVPSHEKPLGEFE